MAKPPKISSLKEQDLAIKEGPVDGRSLRETFRRLFAQLNPFFIGQAILAAKGITLAENERCDLVAGKFTHGVAVKVKLQNLQRANSAIVRGCDKAIPLFAGISMTGAQQASVTVWFQDGAATNVPLVLELREEGQQTVNAPTFVAGFTNPMTTKGDLIAGGAAGAATRLPVGADTQVLTADPAQMLGVKWAAGGGGGPTGASGGALLGWTYPNPGGVNFVGSVKGGGKRVNRWFVQKTGDALYTTDMGTFNPFGQAPTAATLTNRLAIGYTTAATANTISDFQSASLALTRPGFRPRLLIDFRSGSDVTSQRVWLALEVSGLSATAATIAAVANGNIHIGLVYDSAVSANLILSSGDGTNMSGVDTGIAYTADTDYLGVIDWSVAGTLTGIINGTAVAKTTNLSTAAQDLGIEQVITTFVNGARTLYVATGQLDQN